MSTKRRVLLGRAVRCAVLVGAGFALLGCESFREAAGIAKNPPDEFAVLTKAPLVIPPDYNLRPPKPGAAPTNQSSPTDSAQTALFGDDPATVAASLPSRYSPGEKQLLANTGGATADHSIRAQIAADQKAMSTATPSFTDQLLFQSPPDPNAGHPLDADAEHDRLVAEKNNGQMPVEGERPTRDSGTINRSDDGTDKVDTGSWLDGGWFDGIF